MSWLNKRPGTHDQGQVTKSLVPGHWSQVGFTLIEVLVAVAILAGGLVLVIEGMGRTQQALRVSENLVTASQVAERHLTDTVLQLFQEHSLRSSSDSGKEKSPGREFQWARKVEPYADETMEDATKLNRVEVAVDWKEGPRQNQLQLAAILLNR